MIIEYTVRGIFASGKRFATQEDLLGYFSKLCASGNGNRPTRFVRVYGSFPDEVVRDFEMWAEENLDPLLR